MGAFTNYVDKGFFFDQLPPSVGNFYLINIGKKSISLDYLPTLTVHVVCEWPLWRRVISFSFLFVNKYLVISRHFLISFIPIWTYLTFYKSKNNEYWSTLTMQHYLLLNINNSKIFDIFSTVKGYQCSNVYIKKMIKYNSCVHTTYVHSAYR